MPWKPLFQICREIEQLPLRLTPATATELTGVLARRLGVNPSEISRAALLEAARIMTPEYLDVVMRQGAREMKWLVSGRRSADGKREVIRPDHWAFLTMDIECQAARDLDGKVVYADLKGAFGNDLTEEEWQSIERQLAPPSPAPVSKAGAEDRAAPFKARKGGRKKGTGSYDLADAVLLTEMERLLDTGKAASRQKAAGAVVDKAVGGGTEESKLKRLVKKYGERIAS